MSIMDRVKNHISNNRGKYGAVAGAGTLYGAQYASENAPTIINKAAFNTLANGQNLALDVVDKTGYGKEQLQNIGLENKIRPEDIQAGNDFYDSAIGSKINLPANVQLNLAERASKFDNSIDEAKNQYNQFSDNLDNKVMGYINQGTDYIKGLNPFHENVHIGNTMKIEIKNILLEGYSPEVIIEAVYANHPHLDKRNPETKQNRDNLVNIIKKSTIN